jgi:glycosyltransferase involved in cell wall biosynthesis
VESEGSTAGNPLVSVIVAVYNGEQSVGAAIESLLAQDYQPFEVIVVDDGSTDRSGEIADSFQQVRTVRQENRGPAAARNAGLTIAGGELITWLDADDEAPPNKLSLQAGYLQKHPNVDCVLGRQEISFEGIAEPEWFRHDPVFGDLEGINYISAMVRRSVLDQVGGFDPAAVPSEDRDLMVRIREQGFEIAVIPEVVLHRKFSGSNLTFHRPQTHPLFRSLQTKLERQRAGGRGPA